MLLFIFCRGRDGDIERWSYLLKVTELIHKRRSQDLNPGRLAPEPRLWTTGLDYLLLIHQINYWFRGGTGRYKSPEKGFPLQLVERGQEGLPGGNETTWRSEGWWWPPRLRRGCGKDLGSGVEPEKAAGNREHRLRGTHSGCRAGGARVWGGGRERHGSWLERSWKWLPLAWCYPGFPRTPGTVSISVIHWPTQRPDCLLVNKQSLAQIPAHRVTKVHIEAFPLGHQGRNDFTFLKFSFIIYKVGFVIIPDKVEPDRMFAGDPDPLPLFSADFHVRETSPNKWSPLGDFRATAFKCRFPKIFEHAGIR